MPTLAGPPRLGTRTLRGMESRQGSATPMLTAVPFRLRGWPAACGVLAASAIA
jgi:hypothetical protein